MALCKPLEAYAVAYYVSPLFVNQTHLINMAFNSEVALFNLLEDAQTADELLAVIDDYLSEEEV